MTEMCRWSRIQREQKKIELLEPRILGHVSVGESQPTDGRDRPVEDAVIERVELGDAA